MKNLYHLAYVSEANPLPTNKDLLAILNTARRFNAAMGITGMLLFKEGVFVQVLEGVKQQVLDLYNRIEADKRHHSLKILFNEDLKTREFSNWSMGFQNLNGLQTPNIEGINDFMNPNFSPPQLVDAPRQAYKILLHFRSMC